MAGDSFTTLYPGTGGNDIYDELLAIGGKHMPAVKIHGGSLGVDGGPNSVTVPVFVELTDGTAALGTAANPLLINGGTGALFDVKDRLARLAGRVLECDPTGAPWTDHVPLAWGSASAGTILKASAGYVRYLSISNNSTANAISYWVLDASSMPAYSGTPTNVITSGVLAAGGSQGVRLDFTPQGLTFATGLVVVGAAAGTYTTPGANSICVAGKWN